ncbi:MAG: hypothetical protein HOU81_03345 [Hamadaea sp.]|uniref:hypothetical protein n=1 Tax=Hamadaea sp. TaxID=2024425 RepID=UPI0017B805DC|nr:hypothetical protein [Hamadaea sp.]NUR69831.1 hypothetical protein [Hamadaea sp.]NUT19189.1 hypothetical protein [Hamadaea sp.]
MDTLSRTARTTRVVITAVVCALLLGGTLWGSDDDFPFGPFRMYAGVNPPNEPAPDPRIEGVTADGTVILLDEKRTGLRRAEVEASQDAYTADPSLLREVLEAYEKRNPQAAPLVEVRYVNRMHEIHSGRPTGKWTDNVLADWRVAR